MKEVQSNQHAWSQLSEDHYHTFKDRLSRGGHRLNPYILEELGDIRGKKLIHLQCNTGADSILLAKMGAEVVGVDLVPENIAYATRLAEELGVENISFLQSDIMELADRHDGKYDVVFTSEGAIGWLPDKKKWAETVRHLMKDDGFFYAFDSHPFFLAVDEEKLQENVLDIKYPYFNDEADKDTFIGGYAAERRGGVETYFWDYTVSDLINNLTAAGLHIERFNEFPENFWDAGGMERVQGTELYRNPHFHGRFPMSCSIRASVYPAGCGCGGGACGCADRQQREDT